ncbi:MAG: hypothetical protein ACTTKL_05065 [Treponema sp.]
MKFYRIKSTAVRFAQTDRKSCKTNAHKPYSALPLHVPIKARFFSSLQNGTAAR